MSDSLSTMLIMKTCLPALIIIINNNICVFYLVLLHILPAQNFEIVHIRFRISSFQLEPGFATLIVALKQVMQNEIVAV